MDGWRGAAGRWALTQLELRSPDTGLQVGLLINPSENPESADVGPDVSPDDEMRPIRTFFPIACTCKVLDTATSPDLMGAGFEKSLPPLNDRWIFAGTDESSSLVAD
jgi:hypothetical protein